MDVYSAVMKAADHIERNPGDFDFKSGSVPERCGTPGCALGWIGYFAKVRDKWLGCGGVVPGYLGLSPEAHPLYGRGLVAHQTFAFYNRMDAAYGSHEWTYSAPECAKAMRLYAAKYLAPPAPRYDFEALAQKLAREIAPPVAPPERSLSAPSVLTLGRIP